MIVGFHSPLPPSPTGVADYAAALLQSMRKMGNIAVEPAKAAVRLYHLGNNQLHRSIYELALKEPGVIVLHDAVLHHFLLGSLSAAEYEEEFVYNYGEWHRGLAKELWGARARSGVDARFFRYPLLRRVVERSRAVVVHNAGAAKMVRDHVAHAPVFEIPHLFVPPPPGAAATLTGVWFGVFGHLRETKRVPVVLRAFHRVRAVLPRAKLLVAGSWASTELRGALNRELLSEGVALSNHVPEAQFWQNARAMTACINLRWPTAGETSGIGVRFMGIGKPVMVTEAEEVSGFSEISCLRIPPGLVEEETLERMMLWMATEPEHRKAVGEAARAHIAEYHSASRVAEMYWRVLREAA